MSLDANKLVQLIKQAALEAVNAHDPMALKIGEVISTTPLKIGLNQKISVPESQLILTNAVRDHTVKMTTDGSTVVTTVKLGLAAGEKVVLLRCDGGQRFIVLDRVEVPNG